MEDNCFQGSSNDDATELMSQNENLVYTGQTCTPANDDATEVISQDENLVYTGQTCTPYENNSTESSHDNSQIDKTGSRDGSFDPDETYISVSKLRSKTREPEDEPNICNVDAEHKSSDLINGNEFQPEQSNLSNTYSQELTQPVVQSQEIDQINETPPNCKGHDESSNKSGNDTFELMPSQDIQNSLSPTEW